MAQFSLIQPRLSSLFHAFINHIGVSKVFEGCISGAENKNTGLNHIKQEGFKDVTVVKETTFSVEELGSEKTANLLLK